MITIVGCVLVINTKSLIVENLGQNCGQKSNVRLMHTEVRLTSPTQMGERKTSATRLPNRGSVGEPASVTQGQEVYASLRSGYGEIMETKSSAEKRRLKIDRGTVLAIPLSAGEWALGQVICPGINFYIGVSLKMFKEPLSAKCIEGLTFDMFSWTNDAEVFNKSWKNLGKYDLQWHGRLPEYKLGPPGEEIVESFCGLKLRDYHSELDKDVHYKTINSPLLCQDAIQAAFGMREWKPIYDHMKA